MSILQDKAFFNSFNVVLARFGFSDPFGHSNDQNFFADPVIARFSSLLSVNKYRQFIYLSPYDTSFVHFMALFKKAAIAPSVKNGEGKRITGIGCDSRADSHYLSLFISPQSIYFYIIVNYIPALIFLISTCRNVFCRISSSVTLSKKTRFSVNKLFAAR